MRRTCGELQWCQCAGLKTDEQCDLYSVRHNGTAGMFAVFEESSRCCKIGDWAYGFGPIRPDWLSLTNATFEGNKTVNGRSCLTWASHHPCARPAPKLAPGRPHLSSAPMPPQRRLVHDDLR